MGLSSMLLDWTPGDCDLLDELSGHLMVVLNQYSSFMGETICYMRPKS